MRMVHWLFVVSVALFISGIGFVVAGARAARPAPAVAEAPRLEPGRQRQADHERHRRPRRRRRVRLGRHDRVGGRARGDAPQNDEEWAAVGNSAAALIESGNLLMMGGRAVDQGDWVKMSQAMIDAAKHGAEGRRGKERRRRCWPPARSSTCRATTAIKVSAA